MMHESHQKQRGVAKSNRSIYTREYGVTSLDCISKWRRSNGGGGSSGCIVGAWL